MFEDNFRTFSRYFSNQCRNEILQPANAKKKTQEGFFFRCTLVTPYEECWGVPLEQPMRLTRSIVWLSNGIFPTKGAPKLSVIWAHRVCLAPHSRTPHTLTWTEAGIPKSRRSDTLDIWPRAPFLKKNPPSDFCCLVSFSHPLHCLTIPLSLPLSPAGGKPAMGGNVQAGEPATPCPSR